MDSSNESEDDASTIADCSASDDEDDSVCSIVMSTSESVDSESNTSDLMKNYALMLEVPTVLTTTTALTSTDVAY
jgi:hypothetical protein